MIYDVNSPLFRSFLSQKGGSSDKSFCVLPMLLHTCPSNKKIRKNTDTLRHALWDSLSCFGRGLGFCRKTDEQKPKEQKPKASENKPIMTE
ncbi:Wound-induced basic protein [Glycine max]|nr:Wound-induced basic protein [Glycine max]